MHTRVQFPAEIEPFVQFIEDTDPSEIVDQTLAKLRDRISIRTMLTASALRSRGRPISPQAIIADRCIPW
jgi:hypothetical protein